MFDKLRKIVKTGYESVKKGCEVVKDKALALFVGAGYRNENITIGIRYNVLHKDSDNIYAEAFMPFVRIFF